MLLYQIVASGVVQSEETPRIPERDQVRFSGEELDIQHFEQRDLFAGNGCFVYAIP